MEQKPRRKIKITILEEQPTLLEIPGGNGCVAVIYACGSELYSDTLTVPVFCLDCGASWANFKINDDGVPIGERLRGGLVPPSVEV